VLMNANLVGGQRVEGALRSFETAGLLIGRGVHSWGALERMHASERGALGERSRFVSGRLSGASVGCLSLDHVRSLSRPHLLVEQQGGKLHFVLLPATEPLIQVRSLEDDRPITLRPERDVSAGRGAEVLLRTRQGRVALQLFIFLGEVADVELRPLVASALEEASEEQRRTVAATMGQRSEALDQASRRAAPKATAVRWRPLRVDERRVLVDALVSWLESDARYPSRWIRARLREAPEQSWLRRYLAHRHFIQSLSRLLQHDDALRAELQEEMASSGRQEALMERLPSTLREGLRARAAQAAKG